MDCREFRNKHVAFVDDLLPAFDMDAMEGHRFTCADCSRHDTRIRRSLLLVRNLPPIEPSPEFFDKLNARLAQLEPASRADVVGRSSMQSFASFAALAAGIAAVAYLTVETNNYFAHPDDVPANTVSAMAMAPVPVLPQLPKPARVAPMPLNSAALVASVPTGIPIWPAALMANQSPMHFATVLTSMEEGR